MNVSRSDTDSLRVNGVEYRIHRLDQFKDADSLPFSLKVMLENLLRTQDGVNVTEEHIKALAQWDANAQPATEVQFSPARVLTQDLSGVPAIIDLVAMRDALDAWGDDAAKINPGVPVELVVDHSVSVDAFGSADAIERNIDLDYLRNSERYRFLRWSQTAFENFKVVPPGMGIVHQVNIESLARVVMTHEQNGELQAYPDTCVGTDSHTTMENGLGVLGWGVGGIEAEAAMLGQPISMLIPRVVGFKLTGEIPAGATATDVVLTITEKLRQHGVVGKFVEFYGQGVAKVPLANRATIGNMSPEFGSTAAMFPVDEVTTEYMRLTGRTEEEIALVEAYAKEQGMWHDPDRELRFSEQLELDLSTVVPSISGPKRPQDRIKLTDAKEQFRKDIHNYVDETAAALGDGTNGRVDHSVDETFPGSDAPAHTPDDAQDPADKPRPADPSAAPTEGRPSQPVPVKMPDGREFHLDHGAVSIASITSCTNTSNPNVMLAAGVLARNAVAKGLDQKPWVKTSIAPGSKVVTDYYEKSGLIEYLEKIGFYVVGYGCTTCMGNSGPLEEEIAQTVQEQDLAVTSVLSGNRNFEARINPDVKMNYLASPPLVVAYALAGTMDFDFENDPLGQDSEGADVFLRDIWPDPAEVQQIIDESIDTEMFTSKYSTIFEGDHRWQNLKTPEGATFTWEEDSTYVRKPPFFDGIEREPAPVSDIEGARVLLKLGDSVTTDHISPAGSFKSDTPAGRYLLENGVARKDFNSYGSRRGNHEVMIRGTFANIRIKNELLDGVEGGFTRDFTQPDAPQTAVYDAAQNYQQQGTPLVVLGGKEYGSGSSRDWAAKGTRLLGVGAVITESFERIHRSNLIGMGVLPLQFPEGESANTLGLTGFETYSISGITALNDGEIPDTLKVTATAEDGSTTEFDADVRIDTPGEANYYRHGGILQYVLRGLAT